VIHDFLNRRDAVVQFVTVEAPSAPGSLEFVKLFSRAIDPLSFATRIRVGIRVTQVGLEAVDQRALAPVVGFLTAIPAIIPIGIAVRFLTTILAVVTIGIPVIITINGRGPARAQPAP
jgi:hypothetical protein